MPCGNEIKDDNGIGFIRDPQLIRNLPTGHIPQIIYKAWEAVDGLSVSAEDCERFATTTEFGALDDPGQ